MTTSTLTMPTATSDQRRGIAGLLFNDMRYGLISASRTPFALVIALLLPLFFNVMFNLLQSGETVNGVASVQMTTAAIIVFVITSSGYFNMVTGIVTAREKSVLKRIRQTPMPKTVHLMSRIGVSLVVTIVSVVIMIGVSLIAFGLEVRPMGLPALLLAVLLSGFTSCALGLAVTRLIPTVEVSLIVSTATLFPLLFISGVFFPVEGLPGPMQTVLDFLPFVPMAEAVRAPLDPGASGWSFDLGNLLIIASWGVIAMFAAVKTMPWEPQR
ncbi:ABC transporter permease [Glycomyces sp. TRM65418]|uniref:ABC transporter permease n=1 Tax=Glycomyces sp. TRM65418 TaxID=2867006 RepID=UPI001CE682F8|nr:ABC transporter permease [Glycomyces sp. TRM65418]MCC3765521.1 ABC transporter permease [Glycomyces sp. TRM65418]QZD55128.1 ABC transporter permease [Glycomyces sp. TRM65418]